MARPNNNGIVALHDDPKERECVCFELMGFIYKEAEGMGVLYTETHENLWHERFAQAKAGECAYRDRCPIYAKSKPPF
jgi:hypothetical protein